MILGWFWRDKHMIHNRKRNGWYSGSVALLFGCLLSPLFFPAVIFANPIKAFPDAAGWAAYTPGGRGGKIIRVTNLKLRGPGSFAAAVQMKGPGIRLYSCSAVRTRSMYLRGITLRWIDPARKSGL